MTGHRFTGRSGQIVSGLGHITFRARRAIRAGLCRLAILDFGGIPPKRLLVVCKPAVYTNLVDPVRADKVSLSMTTSIQRSLDEGCAPAERYGYVPFSRQTISVMHHDQRPRPHNGKGHVIRNMCLGTYSGTSFGTTPSRWLNIRTWLASQSSAVWVASA